MAAHLELIEEMAEVNDMSTEERLEHAQRRRAEQLEKWEEYENEKNHLNQSNDSLNEKNNAKSVKFGSCITLLEAAARNDYDEIKELLSQKVDPNQANEDGLTALHQACIDNFEEVVELLLEYDANVNAMDSENWTPLHAACTCAHTNIAEVLVRRGADLLALNADQNMPYDICEEESTLHFIEQAMTRKGITQDQINEARQSREKNIIKDIENFLDEGGKLMDVKDKVGASLLHIAAANGYVELTSYLLSQKCDVNARDDDGWTPLHGAACWCQMKVIEVLAVNHNADPTLKNNHGETPADVTEDEEIKVLLQRLVKAQKESKKSKLFRRSYLNGGGSVKVGERGQSFKGRSKRDKKRGISLLEANSEAEYWQKGNKTDLINDDSDDDQLSPKGRDAAQTVKTNAAQSKRDKKSKKAANKSASSPGSKRFGLLKNTFTGKRPAMSVKTKSDKPSKEALRRTRSEGATSDRVDDAVEPHDSANLPNDYVTSSKSRKRGCVIL